MTYHTPGHGLVADALIMHGAVKLLHLSGRIRGVVRRVGDRFEIEGGAIDWERYVRWELHNLVDISVESERELGPLRDLRDAAIDVSNFPVWKQRLKDSLNALPTAFDLSPSHAERLTEGRVKIKKGYTLYLPISLTFGKYRVVDYRAVADTPYVVCPSCFALSTLGYLYGVVKIKIEGENGFTIFNISPIPSGELSVIDLITLQRLAGLVYVGGRAGKGLNALGALVYALSVGETIFAVERPVDFVVWRTERSGNNQRAIAEGVYRGQRLMEALALLKLYFPRWPRIVNELGGDVVNLVGEYLVFGGDPYNVVREVVRDLSSRKVDKTRKKRLREADKIAEVFLNLADK